MCEISPAKLWLTNTVKSVLCYLCCLPLVVISLSFTHSTFFFSPHQAQNIVTGPSLTDWAQMKSKIALFPLPCAHMSQMLSGGVWRHARIKHDTPLAIELTAHRSALLPLFVCVGGREITRERSDLCSRVHLSSSNRGAQAAVSHLYPEMLDFDAKTNVPLGL